MKVFLNVLQLLVFGCLFWGTLDVVYALDTNAEIESGSSFAEVITLWGVPDEKIEFEPDREEVWNYKDGRSILFRNGKTIVEELSSIDNLEIVDTGEDAIEPIDDDSVEDEWGAIKEVNDDVDLVELFKQAALADAKAAEKNNPQARRY